MSGRFIGLDINELRAFAARLSGVHAEGIASVMREIDSSMNHGGHLWVGPDGDRLRDWWPDARTQLSSVEEQLRVFARLASNAADAQESASRP